MGRADETFRARTEQADREDGHGDVATLFAGRIVIFRCVAEMLRPRRDVPSPAMRHGLGFWLDGDGAVLEGYDAGVSFWSVHHPATGTTPTVMMQSSAGAWPLAPLRETFPPGR